MGRLKASFDRSPGFRILPGSKLSWLMPKVLLLAMRWPPELTETCGPPLPTNDVPAAVIVPLTASSAPPASKAVASVTTSPELKVSDPPSVSVWSGEMTTGTFGPTVRVPPDATINPPGKTYWKLDVVEDVPIRLSAKV